MKIILSEHQEAANLAEWLFWQQQTGKLELYTHIPHETYTTSWNAKRKNKVEGVKPGFPDYVIVTKKEVIFLELKKTSGSKTSLEQLEWIARLDGKITKAAVCKGFDAAKAFIEPRLK